MGGDRLAIGPDCVLAQLEGPLGAVFIACPAFRYAGDRITSLGVACNEAFEDRHVDPVFRNTLNKSWIEGLGLGAVGNSEAIRICDINMKRIG